MKPNNVIMLQKKLFKYHILSKNIAGIHILNGKIYNYQSANLRYEIFS